MLLVAVLAYAVFLLQSLFAQSCFDLQLLYSFFSFLFPFLKDSCRKTQSGLRTLQLLSAGVFSVPSHLGTLSFADASCALSLSNAGDGVDVACFFN